MSTDGPPADGFARYLNAGTYYGRALERQQFSGFWMVEVCHTAAVRLPRHTHDTAFLSLLLVGSYSETFGSRTLTYRPATLGFHPPALTHQDTIGDGGGRLFTIELDTNSLTELRDGERCAMTAGEVRDALPVGLMLRLYRAYALTCAQSSEPDPLHVESIGLELLGATLKIPTITEQHRPNWLSRVVETLHEMHTTPTRVTTLAVQAGVHPVHLARVFRKTYGCTMGQYLAHVRVQRAFNLLAATDAPLAQIAAETGFADQSHLTRVFTSVVGSPPGAFRRILRSPRDQGLPIA